MCSWHQINEKMKRQRYNTNALQFEKKTAHRISPSGLVVKYKTRNFQVVFQTSPRVICKQWWFNPSYLQTCLESIDMCLARKKLNHLATLHVCALSRWKVQKSKLSQQAHKHDRFPTFFSFFGLQQWNFNSLLSVNQLKFITEARQLILAIMQQLIALVETSKLLAAVYFTTSPLCHN